jgi:hypothetical protein
MRRTHRQKFSPEEIERIKHLLASTELTLDEIALRMNCAKSSVVGINQHFCIRDYRGHRREWTDASGKRRSNVTW